MSTHKPTDLLSLAYIHATHTQTHTHTGPTMIYKTINKFQYSSLQITTFQVHKA